MPPPAMDIRMIKDVLRLKLHGGLPHEAVARSLSISKGAVAKYVSLAAAGGLTWETIAGLSEAELEQHAAAGELTDVKTLIGLLWLQKWRAGLWPLRWQQPDAAAAGIMPA